MSPTSYDPVSRLLLTPEDPEADAREKRLRELGLGDSPVPEFDAFARRVAQRTGAPCATVTFLGGQRQYFAGLHPPPEDRGGEGESAPPPVPAGREVPRNHGYCPHVAVRRKALVLEDVLDYPRFAANPAVDGTGVRSYLGAPLIDRTDTVLGTVCAMDREPHRWGRRGLETIKELAAELVDLVHRREQDT